jgi:predicted DNA-binding ribbon-helix-helix protein
MGESMDPINSKKRSVIVDGRRTSISLEDEFWVALNMAAIARRVSISQFVTDVMKRRSPVNLSSSVRIAVLAHYQDMLESGAMRIVDAREPALIIPFGRERRTPANGSAAMLSPETESA